MELDIYKLLKDGMSKDEIDALINRALADTKKKYAAEIACAEARVKDEEAAAAAQVAEDEKKALMAEGRAYFINAILAYTEAIEGKTLTEEEIADLEKAAIEMEEMLIKFMQFKNKLSQQDVTDLGELFDLFGF